MGVSSAAISFNDENRGILKVFNCARIENGYFNCKITKLHIVMVKKLVGKL